MSSTTGTRDGRQIKSVARTLEILEFVHREGRVGVTEIADHLDLSKGTVYCHLNTLHENRFLARNGEKYEIGLRFLGFGGKRATQHDLYRFGKPEADELVAETGETVQIGVEEHGMGIYIYQSRGEKAVRTDSYVGTERYLHSTSFGKAILAHLPPERVDEIIDRHGLPAVTNRTITDREELFGQLGTIRDRGVAFDDCEQIDGIRCVAVPILRPDGTVLGAISLTGPTKRMKSERFHREIPDLVEQTARVIEINIANF
jgi:DNA-binding IclR family transcriptional regulator